MKGIYIQMRRDKHKHTRRAVRFYRVHHGFREPFKVLTKGARPAESAD